MVVDEVRAAESNLEPGIDVTQLSSDTRKSYYAQMASALTRFSEYSQLSLDYHRGRKQSHSKRVSGITQNWEETTREICRGLVSGSYSVSIDKGSLSADTSVSNVFLEVEKTNYDHRPDISRAFLTMAELLLDVDRQLAAELGFAAFVDAFWGNGWRYEHEDVMDAIYTIPQMLRERGLHNEAVAYILHLLDALLTHLSIFEHDEYEGTTSVTIAFDVLFEDWQKTDELVRARTLNWIVRSDEFVANEFVFSRILKILTAENEFKGASELVSHRFDLAINKLRTTQDRRIMLALTKEIEDEWKLFRELLAKDKSAVLSTLRQFEAFHLEDRVDELAEKIGFDESHSSERNFEFKDPELRKCVKSKNVEVDVLRSRIDYINGKRKERYFIAECKTSVKKASWKDFECFVRKANDFIAQEKAKSKSYKGVDIPRIEEPWFVSLSGFDFDTKSSNRLKVDSREVVLVDKKMLNAKFKRNSVRLLPDSPA